MPDTTAGALTASHIGATVTLSVTGPPMLVDEQVVETTQDATGALVRVQHNASETLIATSAWSGALDPTHPITVED